MSGRADSMNEGHVNTGSVELRFLEGPPAGPPVILLHALFSMGREFAVLTPGLEKIARVFVLDLRGHGLSGHDPSYRVEDYAADVAAFIKGRVGEPAVV